jgi:hypothetical protein
MLAEGVGNAPTSAMPILFSRQVQPAYICLPSRNGQGGKSCTLVAVRKHPPSSEVVAACKRPSAGDITH